MELTTYKSLLTGKRTWLVANNATRCGHVGYVEYTIQFQKGQWLCYKTDGYKLDLVGIYSGSKGLKSVLNLVWNS